MKKSKHSIQNTKPLHLENTVLSLGKEDLNIENAFNTYREMKLDGVVSGSMGFIKSVLNKSFTLSFKHTPTTKETFLLNKLESSLKNIRAYDESRLINNILQMLDYGCSLHEVVLERKDGHVVIGNISPIHLSTVEQFEMENGELKTLHIGGVENDGLLKQSSPSSKVSGEKVLFFRLEADSDFPLGKSLLYGAYTAWRTKKILQEYECIGVAKNLSGVLKVSVPSDYLNKYYSEPNSHEAIYINDLITQVESLHAGKGSFVMSASDTNANGVRLFEVTTIGGEGQGSYDVGKAIQRYNQEIQLSLQSSVLSLGVDGGGSFALSDNSTHLMTLFIENIRNTIALELRKALKLVWVANGLKEENAPHLEWDEIEPIDWEEFTRGWQRLLQSGGVTPTVELETYLREAGGAPAANYESKLDNDTKADSVDRLDDSKGG